MPMYLKTTRPPLFFQRPRLAVGADEEPEVRVACAGGDAVPHDRHRPARLVDLVARLVVLHLRARAGVGPLLPRPDGGLL